MQRGRATENEILTKSSERIALFGEVFTPSWIVEEMLNLIPNELARIDARFLEPACGSGNFLIPVLQKKLDAVKCKYDGSIFNQTNYAALALMSIYGIEILEDNAKECRDNLTIVFSNYLKSLYVSGVPETDLAAHQESLSLQFEAARTIVNLNIAQADALTMKDSKGKAIILPEWAYLGEGKFKRRDFRFENLTHRSSIEGSLFSMLDEIDNFKPVETYPICTLKDLAEWNR